MANALHFFDRKPETQATVDAEVAKLTAADACRMLCFYVVCSGDQMSLRDEETKVETPRGLCAGRARSRAAWRLTKVSIPPTLPSHLVPHHEEAL